MSKPKKNKKEQMKEWLNQPLKMKFLDSKAEYFGRLEEILPALRFHDFFLGRFFPQVQKRYEEHRIKYRFLSEDMTARLLFFKFVDNDEIYAYMSNPKLFRAKIRRDYDFE